MIYHYYCLCRPLLLRAPVMSSFCYCRISFKHIGTWIWQRAWKQFVRAFLASVLALD